MTSIAQSTNNSNSASKYPAEELAAAPGKKSPVGAVPGQPSNPSTGKPTLSPNASQSFNANMANGGSAVQLSHSGSVSPVNGKPSITPAVPALGGAPTIVNGNNVLNAPGPTEHKRSPSFTVGSNGITGSGTQGKASNIQFGSHDAAGSPAATGLSNASGNNLGVTAQMNPRMTSPQTSPSPIPQPATVSGGRPPSGLQGQGNAPVFGNFNGNPTGPNGQVGGMPANNLGPGPQHLRRESSQSSHSDMSNPNVAGGRGYGPMQGGRGRGGSFQSGYPNSGYPPNNAQHRPSPNSRGSSNMGHGYYGGRQGFPGSPSLAARSPAMNPPTPQMGNMQMANPGMQNQFGQFPPHMQQTGYGMPSPYDPQGQMYYNNQFMPMGGYMPPPQSPRPPFGMPQGAQPQYMQHQYSNQGPPQQAPSMSRNSSQMSAADRPSSSMGQPQTPSVTAQTQPSPRNTNSPGPKTSHFTVPAKKSSAIVIKDPNSGAVKNFEKVPASPARATPPPMKTGTPPVPSQPSAPVVQPSASPAPVGNGKTDEEKKNEMRDAVARKLAEEAAAQKKEAEEKTAQEKAETVAKVKEAEEEAARAKADADAKAKAKAKAEEEAKATKAAEEAKAVEEQKKKDAEDAKAKEAEIKPAAESNPAEEEIDYDAIEAEYARMEAEEAAREAEYQKKKLAEKEAQERKEAEAAAAWEANMKNAEREAEAIEEARMKRREIDGPDEAATSFAQLKLGGETLTPQSEGSPAVATPEASGAATPVSDAPLSGKGPASSKREKPVPLKLETAKSVEPAQPTPAMKSLQSARKISDLSVVAYPSSVVSPNPALNANAPADRKFHYNKEFLLQFQNIFKEKPSIDWDARVRDTLGDGGEPSGRPQSARTPSSMGARSASNRPSVVPSYSGMGSFGAPSRGGPITLPPGTTSEQRFQLSNNMGRGGPIANPFQQFGRPAGIPVGGTSMSRGPSSQNLAGGLPGSPRTGASGRNSTRSGSKRDKMNTKKEEDLAKSMPLTAGLDLKPITVSAGGWKPRSIGQGLSGPALGSETHLAPDVVQRKVKSNLNKMTPENFDKIANQILEIAAQSKDETDGRTLRQVIQLTFEKATDEAHWAPMYAKFAKRMLESMSNEVRDENIKDKNGNVVAGGNLFRKYLLNRCQEEFERGWKVNLPEKPEGVTEEVAMMSEEYYLAAAAKRRGLGLVKFIGELFKLGMLTERIMHECVKKLLDYGDIPDEAEVESLTSLLRTIGGQLDLHSTLEKGPQMMEVYFVRIQKAIELPELPSRLRFMLMDIVDLRKARWVSKDQNKGPKTIQEVHEEAQRAALEAEQERLRTQARGGPRAQMGRGDARNFSGGYGQMPPPDSSSSRVGTDDLRRLGSRAARSERNLSGAASMGPGGMFSSGRTGSGRRNLGPGGLKAGDESGASSRTATPPAQKKEEADNTSKNAFSALASLEGESASMATSPPSTAGSPPVAHARPIQNVRPKSPVKETPP